MQAKVSYEKLHSNPAFETYKIKQVESKRESFVIATIFKCSKMTAQVVTDLEKILKAYNDKATAMVIDVTNITMVSPQVLEQNAKIITTLGNDASSTVHRVSLITGKIAKIAFEALMKLAKPKAQTRIFSEVDEALCFALDVPFQQQNRK